MDPLGLARYGMMSAQRQLVRSAARAASGPDDGVDLAGGRQAGRPRTIPVIPANRLEPQVGRTT